MTNERKRTVLGSQKWKKVKLPSHVRLFAAPWTIACQAPPSMDFSRQEYWNGLPFPSPGDLPDPGIEPESPALRQTLYHLSHQGTSPWNSPGQNTGVGSLSFLQGIFPTQGSNPGLLHCRWILYQPNHKGTSPWNSPGQNTGVGSLSCLQGIFPTQGLKPRLPHCRQILYQLNPQGSPWAAKWLSNSGSKGSIHAHPGQNWDLSHPCVSDALTSGFCWPWRDFPG